MSSALAPAISGVLHDLPTLIERTLKHEAACHTLQAQCNNLLGHIEAKRARIAQEKAAQRLLRAEIASFLCQRGQMRSANSSRVKDESLMESSMSVAGMHTEDSIFSPDAKTSTLSYAQESPLSLKSKRKGRVFRTSFELTPSSGA